MGWLLEKADRLAGTIFAAIVGVAASQLQAFVQAYLQRLGGHLDEARRMARELGKPAGATGATSDAAPAEQVTVMLEQRIAELETAIRAIEQANPYLKPIAFFTHMDAEIAAAAGANFVPALPLDAPGIAYALAGAVLGWIVWELVKWPARAIIFGRRRDTTTTA